MLTRSDSSKLYVRIATSIRSQIEDGVYQPGDRLPPLSELAKQEGCSRATIREALGTLRGQGLIEFRQGDGTYVKTALVDLWMEPLDAALLLGIGQVRELVELQTAILAAIASRLAETGDANSNALTQSLFQLECAVPNSEESITAELSFYLKMAECAGNPLLENVIRVMQESYRSCLRLQYGSEQLGIDTCRAVFDAISRHRSDVAREIIYTYGRAITRRLEMERSGKLKGIPVPIAKPQRLADEAIPKLELTADDKAAVAPERADDNKPVVAPERAGDQLVVTPEHAGGEKPVIAAKRADDNSRVKSE